MQPVSGNARSFRGYRLGRYLLAIGLAMILFRGALTPAAAQPSVGEVRKVVAMFGARSGATWPLWIAQRGGYYRKHGLDVELVFGVHPAPIAAIISGHAVMTSSGADPGVLAVSRDPSLTLIGSFLNKGSFAMVAAKHLTSIRQLAGKKIGVGRVGDPPYHLTINLLEKFGVSVEDVHWVSIGVDAAARAAALQSGQIDAALITAPSYFRLEAVGFPILAQVSDYEDIYVSTYYLLRKETVVTSRRVAEAFIKAHAEAIKRFYDDKPFAIQTMIKYGGAKDQQDASRVYDLFSKSRLFEPIPYILRDSVKAAVERQSQAQPQLKQFDFSKVIDNSLVDGLVKEGFFEQIFGSSIRELQRKRQAEAFGR
ncbi:MAG TPA: ABC transporter substrate-binding protein [Candidatus Binatia bacterium]|jgi:ABC-type nitrate/sulfonate/bicarbonate transport system substrate-binding protein|nr:ABC transporter substrate-binding protein [Candidatus Binatia bacterium]